MATVQRLRAVICIAFISSGFAEPLPKSGFNYREFFPGNIQIIIIKLDCIWMYIIQTPIRIVSNILFLDTSHRINRRGGMDDVMHVPDDTWEVEKNYTMTHPERRGVGIIRQVGSDQTPPSTACITIKAIYDSNWVQSSGGDGAAQVRAVLAEAENIFMAKFATNNQLGTSISFNFEGKQFLYFLRTSIFMFPEIILLELVNRAILPKRLLSDGVSFIEDFSML